MLKGLSIVWVKTVNNLFTSGWVSSVLLSPVYKKVIQGYIGVYGKVLFTHKSIPQNNTLFSTSLFSYLHPLIGSYTHNPQGLLLRPQKRN